MPAFFKNKFVLFGAAAVALFIGLVVFWSVVNLMTQSTGLSGSGGSFAPELAGRQAVSSDMAYAPESSYLPGPTPNPGGGYTSNLEQYETTDYSVRARTQQFDTLCQFLENLKADERYDFRSLNASLNYCGGVFYSSDADAPGVVAQFEQFDGVVINRTTNSVTRHREQLQSQTQILQQQLASVNRSLGIAETEFDEIAQFARDNNDASTLSEAIREKLNLIDTLTQRRIQLTSRLDSLYQQAADLKERIGVTQFSVSITRSYPLDPDETSRAWERAWEALSDTYTDTLIGLTAVFGIIILWAIRLTIYGAVALIAIRLLWKFVKLIWRF